MRIGMLGGLGPESTVDYYSLIIKKYRELTMDGSYPEIIILSLDMNKILKLVDNKEWDKLTHVFYQGILSLHEGGADFGFIASNTPHVIFERLNEISPIPLISIVEEAYSEVYSKGIKKVGLLGTAFTMESDFFQKVFSKGNIEIVAPNKVEQRYIHDKLMKEIEHGIFKEETREGLLEIIERMLEEDGIEGIILGCTELPLILTESRFGIEFFNTTRIHISGILKYFMEHRGM